MQQEGGPYHAIKPGLGHHRVTLQCSFGQVEYHGGHEKGVFRLRHVFELLHDDSKAQGRRRISTDERLGSHVNVDEAKLCKCKCRSHESDYAERNGQGCIGQEEIRQRHVLFSIR